MFQRSYSASNAEITNLIFDYFFLPNDTKFKNILNNLDYSELRTKVIFQDIFPNLYQILNLKIKVGKSVNWLQQFSNAVQAVPALFDLQEMQQIAYPAVECARYYGNDLIPSLWGDKVSIFSGCEDKNISSPYYWVDLEKNVMTGVSMPKYLSEVKLRTEEKVFVKKLKLLDLINRGGEQYSLDLPRIIEMKVNLKPERLRYEC